MLAVISPAKKLDESPCQSSLPYTLPDALTHTQSLIDTLSPYSEHELAELMKLSDKLAVLNVGRYQAFNLPFTPANAKQAAMMFQGDTYVGLQAQSMNQQDISFAQEHLRILSGLYGTLRPMDLIQPYRLEMGTRLKNERGKDLYAFWGELPTQAINQATAGHADRTLINLASNEYFKAVKTKQLAGPIITPVFKEIKNGQAKVIGLMAKRARGMMARYLIDQRLESPEPLKSFTAGGYAYQAGLSTDSDWIFTRQAA
ncbi:peroxide stress protein YaaA [Magnetococcus sp. PR-3]|uniref:peroxide stress protein YaaA n=1 Tax=Magnetococcus sp. PR-3 TaxID=3120355 RepID=UPI002FCE2FE7